MLATSKGHNDRVSILMQDTEVQYVRMGALKKMLIAQFLECFDKLL